MCGRWGEVSIAKSDVNIQTYVYKQIVSRWSLYEHLEQATQANRPLKNDHNPKLKGIL